MLSCGAGWGGGENAGEAIPSVRMERTTRPETATLSVPFSRSLVIWTAWGGLESQKMRRGVFPVRTDAYLLRVRRWRRASTPRRA